MKLTLEHDEIVAAIEQFVTDQGVKTEGKVVEVTMIAGRGANGHSAIVDIRGEGTAATQTEDRDRSESNEKSVDELAADTDVAAQADDLFGSN